MNLIGLIVRLLAVPAIALPAQGQVQYDYRVIASKSVSRANFIQGLEIVDGLLYVSAGGYGSSRLLRYRFADGELVDSARLHPRLFAEGLTVVGENIYLLTWRARKLLAFNRRDLTLDRTLPLSGEGWGLTHNDCDLVYSDGSSRLRFVDPATGNVRRSIEVTEAGVPVTRLNELEWVEDKIWANVWQSDKIVIIEPATGVVTGTVSLTGLLPISLRQADTDVLNGIARNPVDGSIWVTGKRWPKMYQIELINPQPQPTGAEESR